MMKRTIVLTLGISFVILVLLSCSRKSVPASSSGETTGQVAVSGPPCIVYRTKADFAKRIPVEMNAEKTRLASFPDVTDIYRNGELAYPTALMDGYLLDNRGIGPNVAFLTLTYDDYRKLGKTPSAEELMNNILERDPLTEMYQCGNRSQYTDLVTELNHLISSGKMAECKKLK